jgi:hypothetical protein
MTVACPNAIIEKNIWTYVQKKINIADEVLINNLGGSNLNRRNDASVFESSYSNKLVKLLALILLLISSSDDLYTS